MDDGVIEVGSRAAGKAEVVAVFGDAGRVDTFCDGRPADVHGIAAAGTAPFNAGRIIVGRVPAPGARECAEDQINHDQEPDEQHDHAIP